MNTHDLAPGTFAPPPATSNHATNATTFANALLADAVQTGIDRGGRRGEWAGRPPKDAYEAAEWITAYMKRDGVTNLNGLSLARDE